MVVNHSGNYEKWNYPRRETARLVIQGLAPSSLNNDQLALQQHRFEDIVTTSLSSFFLSIKSQLLTLD